MTSEGSVSVWLDQLKAGDAGAAQKLWDRYFQRLAGLVRLKLRGAPLRAANEEDVALSAFASFFRGVEHGRFPNLNDRDNLWHLLVVITVRKSTHHLRRQKQQKRGGDVAPAPVQADVDLEMILSREPPPELAVEMEEECRRLLDLLGDPGLENVVLAKLEGYTNEEIATQLGCAPCSVERKLRLIRDLWTQEKSDE